MQSRSATFLPLLLLLLACSQAAAVEVRLAGPLSTQVDLLGEFPAEDAVLTAQISVPRGAPADLMVCAYALEDAGAWRQSCTSQRLEPGRQRIALRVPGRPGAAAGARSVAGLLFSTTATTAPRILVDEVGVLPAPPATARRILDLGWDDPLTTTGKTWQLRLKPESALAFSLDGSASGPDGALEPLAGRPSGAGWTVAFTPPRPGLYHIEIQAHWAGSSQVVQTLTVEASGEAPPMQPAPAIACRPPPAPRPVPAAPPAGEPCLDRLRLSGLDVAVGGLSVAVGSTWSASVVPVPDLPAALCASLTDGAGQTRLISSTVEASGRHRFDFHPSLPGIYAVRLQARWPDGRQVDSPLPRLTVTGALPCRNPSALTLRGPLVTIQRLPIGQTSGANRIEAIVLVPDGAPADLAVGAVAFDHHDRWFQPVLPQALHAGVNRLSLVLNQRAGLPGGWTANTLAQVERTALAFTTASPAPLRLIVGDAAARPVETERASTTPRLLDLACSTPRGMTGERWSLALRPDPFPANPYDPDDFRLDLVVTTPEGGELLLPGFYAEDMGAIDRGDREQLKPTGAGGFQVRYRPRTPGIHRLAVQATWRGGASRRCALPPLVVDGAPWDGYVRVDRKDPRFFAIAGSGSGSGAGGGSSGFFWPIGPNLRSVWDLRSQNRMHTRLTPDRGSLAYRAYLRRFAAAGANACEIWMSAWNLALEWRRDWPGFDGVGRYNQENAWRLDRILDAAWAEGMRVNLVINNHGQASDHCDQEWANNPYNQAAGGRLAAVEQVFRDPWALLGQDKLRRYIVGRYADHPAVLGWKLWTEMDLTNGGAALRPWHEQAVKRWRELDAYGHPVASHWCGDYTHPKADIVSLLDYVCIDAYHGDKAKDTYRLVHRLLRDSTLAGNGLARLGKPVLVTEYGGNWSGARNDALMAVDHASGAWTAFVSGHAGAPMLWWFEWVDQGGRFDPYGAIGRFAAGEDLRGDGHAVAVRVEAPGSLWAAAWQARGRLYGYAIDERWAEDGTSARPVEAQFVLDAWPAGAVTCAWWDADSGVAIASQRLMHPGGALRLASPTFRRHLAWKLTP